MTHPGRPTIVRYSGNGVEGSAHCLHMLLAAAAEGPAVPPPGFLACLSTLAFGHTLLAAESAPTLEFAPPSLSAEDGLSRAVTTVGATWKVAHEADPARAIEGLRSATVEHPALAGPLDQGKLRHNPAHEGLLGLDHYVVVLGVDPERVRFHDPEGFANASLPIAEFLEAWGRRTDPNSPANHVYGYGLRWHQADRTRPEMVRHILPFIKPNLMDDPGGPEVYGGPEALRDFATALREPVSPEAGSLLAYYTLPAGARRATEGAAFLAEADKPEAAALLAEQARLIGMAQPWAVAGAWDRVAAIFESLAATDFRLIAAL